MNGMVAEVEAWSDPRSWRAFLASDVGMVGSTRPVVNQIVDHLNVLRVRKRHALTGEAAGGICVSGPAPRAAAVTAAAVKRYWRAAQETAAQRSWQAGRGDQPPLWFQIPAGMRPKAFHAALLAHVGVRHHRGREPFDELTDHFTAHPSAALVVNGFGVLPTTRSERTEMPYFLYSPVKRWPMPLVLVVEDPQRHLFGQGVFRASMNVYLTEMHAG